MIPFATSVIDYPHDADRVENFNCISHEELAHYQESQATYLYERDKQNVMWLLFALYAMCIIFKVYHNYVVNSLKRKLESNRIDIDFNRIQIEMLNNAIDALGKQQDNVYRTPSGNHDAIIDMKGWDEPGNDCRVFQE